MWKIQQLASPNEDTHKKVKDLEIYLKQKRKQISNLLDKIGKTYVMFSDLNKYLEDQKSHFAAQITQQREENTAINKEKSKLKNTVWTTERTKTTKIALFGYHVFDREATLQFLWNIFSYTHWCNYCRGLLELL